MGLARSSDQIPASFALAVSARSQNGFDGECPAALSFSGTCREVLIFSNGLPSRTSL